MGRCDRKFISEKERTVRWEVPKLYPFVILIIPLKVQAHKIIFNFLFPPTQKMNQLMTFWKTVTVYSDDLKISHIHTFFV